jgi:hypothetical protein
MSLTVEQAREIADAFMEAGEAIDEYLNANFNNISRPEYEFLNESVKTLLRVATFATTEAVGLAIDEINDSATDLKTIIGETKEKIENIQKVGLTIRLVAGLADIAAGIIAKDAGAVASSAKNLHQLIKAV